MTLKVCETFYSLMGESTRVGLPAWFIRLSGCNLRCTYCDTAYAYEEGREVAVTALLKAARNFSSRLVLVTGGEPLLQEFRPDIVHLHTLTHKHLWLIEHLGSRGFPLVQTWHDHAAICLNHSLYSRTGSCERCRGGHSAGHQGDPQCDSQPQQRGIMNPDLQKTERT